MMPRMKTLLPLVVILACWGCGGGNPSAQPPTATDTQTSHDSATVSNDPDVQFFHDQLITNGEELQTDFGTYLSTLGMNPRDLQQDDPQHAFDTVMEKVRATDDLTLRADMMRTFFNRADK
jgi:hypothetical protein